MGRGLWPVRHRLPLNVSLISLPPLPTPSPTPPSRTHTNGAGFCYVNDIVLAVLELLKYHQR